MLTVFNYCHWPASIGLMCFGVLQAHCYCGSWKGVLLCWRGHQQLFTCKNHLPHFLNLTALQENSNGSGCVSKSAWYKVLTEVCMCLCPRVAPL